MPVYNDSDQKAELALRRLIYQLRASDEPGAATLAEQLDACSKAQPCRYAACPRCGATFQAAAVDAVDHFIRQPARAIRSRMHASTIVPASGCVSPGALTAEACERVGVEIMAALADLGLPPTLVGLDISFNEDTTGEVEPHWCIHGHGVGLDWLTKAQRAGLRTRFLPSPFVAHPTRVEPLDQNIRGRQYPFKAERARRETYLDDNDGKRKPCRETRHRSLRPAQAVALALVDQQLGFEGRLLTHKISREAVLGHLRACWRPRDGPSGG